MSLLIGLSDSSWQRASPQFPARLSAWSLGLVQHPCPELLDGGLLSLYLVPTAPAAWHEVSLNCLGSNREPFLLSVLFCFLFFLYLENKWAIHPRGGHVGPPTNPASAGVTVSRQPASPGGEGTEMPPWASSPLTTSCSPGRPPGCQEHYAGHQCFFSSTLDWILFVVVQ